MEAAMTANTRTQYPPSKFALGVRLIVLVLLVASCSMAQGADANLTSELEALHASWYKAYDTGNLVAMDEIETANLTLVLPDGNIWTKSKARTADKLPAEPPDLHHSVTNTTIRRFGDAAVLTGILTASSAKEGTMKMATTVVFIKDSGKWKIASAQLTLIGNQ